MSGDSGKDRKYVDLCAALMLYCLLPHANPCWLNVPNFRLSFEKIKKMSYYYTTSESETDSDYDVPIYFTDGSQTSGGSGCAYYVHRGCKESFRNEFEPETSLTAELFAIYGALQRARRKREYHVIIRTDSLESIRGIRSNGMTPNGKSRKHHHLYRQIRRYYESRGMKVPQSHQQLHVIINFLGRI